MRLEYSVVLNNDHDDVSNSRNVAFIPRLKMKSEKGREHQGKFFRSGGAQKKDDF